MSSLIFFALGGFNCEINIYSAVMAAVMALFCIGYTVVGFYIMKDGKMALYTIFLMTGGMIVPYIWGLIFLNEQFSILRTLGLIVVAAAVMAVNADSKSLKRKQLIMCVAVFLFNGFVSVVSKEHQINANAVSAADFVILTSISKTVICLPCILFSGDRTAEKERMNLQSAFMVVCAAVFSGMAYFLQLRGASALPATVIYPFITGGSIVFTALAGKVFFKESLGLRMFAGIVLCLIGTCMFL